jgi:hypothetical protein
MLLNYWKRNNLTKENFDEFIEKYFRDYLNGVETPADCNQSEIVQIPFWKRWFNF